MPHTLREDCLRALFLKHLYCDDMLLETDNYCLYIGKYVVHLMRKTARNVSFPRNHISLFIIKM